LAAPIIKQAAVINVTFGDRVTIVEPVNLYGCKIGDDTFVGPFVEIQKTAIIGHRCRIQSHTFICEMVNIGNDCFIAHGVMFVNDKFAGGGPARGNKVLWLPTRIGNHVSIGSGAIILPVTICDNAVIGAGSVVTKDINEAGIYAGNPARLIKKLNF
jgi:acetyltransferase-like isoleucine patch superfamily enzyme